MTELRSGIVAALLATACGGGDSDTSASSPSLEFDDLFGVPNVDDDDGSGSTDWDENAAGLLGEENDLIAFTISAAEVKALGATRWYELQLQGDGIRIWSDGEVALGEGSASDRYVVAPGA